MLSKLNEFIAKKQQAVLVLNFKGLLLRNEFISYSHHYLIYTTAILLHLFCRAFLFLVLKKNLLKLKFKKTCGPVIAGKL